MKKAFLLFFLLLLIFSLVPDLVKADVGKYDKEWCEDIPLEDRRGGLVPCGRSCNDPFTEDIDESEPCTLCHFFMMIDRWIDSLLIIFVPIIAALMIAVGGFMYVFAYAGGGEGGPEMLSRAKRLFTAVAIGLLIIYSAFFIIGMFLQLIGLAEWTEDIYRNWWKEGFFEIPCP